MEKVYLVIILLVLTFVYSKVLSGPVVFTNVGLIRGLHATDGGYSMFLGIPFAKVDKKNPFGVASPYPKFKGIFGAFSDSAICPQVEDVSNTITGSLDCLQLNIFVPFKTNFFNKLPILIFVHGGFLSQGNFDRYAYGPKFLVAHQIILVTINYRVGVYGFMCLDTPQVPGNQGLKDQYLAIQWVYNNIQAFGGNKNQITLMGQSAGSKSVELHLLSDRPYLFERAILQSGSALGPDFVNVSDQTAPLKIAQNLGYDTNDINLAISFLAKKEPKSVVASALQLGLVFRVCVEKRFDNIRPFVTEHPEKSDFSKAKKIPILAGFNSQELIILYNNKTYFLNPNIFLNKLKILFDFDSDEMPNVMRRFYIGDKKINEETILEQIDFLSDYRYDYAIQRSLDRYAKYGRQDIYQYKFSYIGGRSYRKRQLNITVGGAGHFDDLGYLFDQEFLKEAPGVEDQLIIDRMTTMWTNFVKYGNPTPKISDLLPIAWLPKTENVSHYLEINVKMELGTRPFYKRLTFWEQFYEKNEKYLRANTAYFRN